MIALLRNMLLCLLCCSVSAVAFAQTNGERSISFIDGAEVSYRYFPAKGNKLFVWIPTEAGILKAEQNLITQVAATGIEVWYPDFLGSNFLSTTATDVDKIPATQVEGIVSAAVGTGKQVYLLSSARGAIPALRGARLWQQKHADSSAFQGVILLSPKLYIETPDPGQAAKLMPIVSISNLPMVVLQPRQSPWYWKLEQTIPALEKGGSEVFVRTLPNLRDRFNYRPDATKGEQAFVIKLPGLFQQATQLLSFLPPKRQAVKITKEANTQSTSVKRERVLTPYPGSPLAPALRLESLTTGMLDINDYRDKVILVNFWASWCPPCVHEMPSMQRLSDSLIGKPFAMLAVNMAEDKATVQKFVNEKIAVDFSILFDKDGAALKRWGVFAFPTTYIIGKQGRIRYALFGSRQWDSPDVYQVLEKLMAE